MANAEATPFDPPAPTHSLIIELDAERAGIGLNYMPTHVRVEGPVRCCAMLVRGEDRYGHFDLINRPPWNATRRRSRCSSWSATSVAIRSV
jgi:hypothetical protein